MMNRANRESVEKLRDLIKDIDIAMLTTVDSDGTLRSRPMGTQQAEFDGDLWFITRDDTAKVDEIYRQNQVNVSYARPDKQLYVSVSGTTTVLRDRAKIQEFWSPMYKAFFPDGPDDPHLCLLKVHVEKAEYWQGPNGLIPSIIGFAKALAGNAQDMGENEKIQVNND